jgi:two-component SAPR family response regulator
VKALGLAKGQGKLEEAEALLVEASRLLSRGTDHYDLAAALGDLSMIQTSLGKPHDAYAASLRAHEILEKIGAPHPLATSLNNLGVDAHLQGNYVEALNLFAEAAKFARQAASPHKEAVILFGQADLFADIDLALQAAELYAQGLALATQLDNPVLLRYGCIQSSVLHRRRGGGALAHEWLRRAISLDPDHLSVPIEIQLSALEIPAAPSRAQARLRALLEDSGKVPEAPDRTLVTYFVARAALADGDAPQARQSLLDALAWAGAHGTEQTLAAELAFDAEMREFSRRQLTGNPVLSIILHRIETMRAVSGQYQEEPKEESGTLKLELHALGQSSLARGGERVEDIKPLAREILFYLGDQQRVDRDVLLETFWPHYNPGRQISNLHTAIYSLRRLLGRNAIVQAGNVYSLNPEMPVEYDVARFERAAEVASALPPGDPRRLFALTAALNSYSGRFLPDFASDWVLDRRRRLEVLYLDLLASHAEEAIGRDQPQKALATLRQALEIDPLRDDTNLRFLETLGRLGRRSELVAHYQRYVRLLADELGLDPPEQIRQLYTRLIG